ncbi:MAG: acyl-CoA/acyl-ACP dehydrogenase [Actinobacteria bacterium]|nr:acyl-CoA/acyl-ACP dehydrogenase [Actinomycetota bacterium]
MPTDDRDAFVALARELGTQFGDESAARDRDGSFVAKAYDVMRDAGYLALAVPTELGGMGASLTQVTLAQAEMSKHCASASLAVSMHHHITLFAGWRYRREMPGAEGLLRRIADDRIVLVSTGGSDFTRPNGTAEKVDGGYRLNARKIFSSQVPVGDVFSTMFTYEDPEQGRRVLGMSVPVKAEGVEVLDTWDAMGMRGTGSHDVQMTDVFAADAQVASDRPWGVIDPPLLVIGSLAMPVITGVYLGVAEAARDYAVAAVAGKARAEDPLVQRQVGLMDTKLRVARWSLLGALDVIGPDPRPDVDAFDAAMAAKRCVAEEGIAVCDLAMDVAGGASFYRGNPIEQCYRDIRAIKFHPLTPEQSLLHAGRVALGLPADDL